MGGKRMEFSYTQLKPVLATGPTCFTLAIAEGAALWLTTGTRRIFKLQLPTQLMTSMTT